MYAMTGTLSAQSGRRTELVEILKHAADLVGGMKGCRLYIATEDITNESLVVMFEMWEDKSSHDESLKDPRVRALIAEAMPILNGPPNGYELRVIGGFGV